jgi:hypothetical protein
MQESGMPAAMRSPIKKPRSIVDRIASALRQTGVEPRLTYNRHHITVPTTGYNFCWFHTAGLALTWDAA